MASTAIVETTSGTARETTRETARETTPCCAGAARWEKEVEADQFVFCIFELGKLFSRRYFEARTS